MATPLMSSPMVVGQQLFTTSADQLHNLGERVETNDGRAYRYCKAGATTLVVGKLQQSAAELTNHQNLTPVAAAIGDTSVTVALGATAATANQYAGGYLVVTLTPGQGQQYKIKSHPAAALSTSVVLTLEDPIVVAITTSSRCDLVPNPYSAVVINPTTATSSPVGVAIFAITNGQFGWLQVEGPATIVADGAITVGVNVSASNAVAGAVEAAVTAQGAVGRALTGIADADHGAIMLNLG
ncbi:MAG: hypothetical protein HYZ51_02070 [Candidatus Doudnabacteria bacterium]|nr:hypothetical protein [Candidatus Doudnabacteria bacterium]